MEADDVSRYQVGILCALPHELSAVWAAFDEGLPAPKAGLLRDDNVSSYVFGKIGRHNVVAACLPAGTTGKAAAATVSKDLMRSFPMIKVGLMVGIGGGAPNTSNDIRLGDVVVAQPNGDGGGVVQYDFGKEHPKGFKATGTLNKPPVTLMGALSRLKAAHGMRGGSQLADHLKELLAKLDNDWAFPGTEIDRLFDSQYDHIGSSEELCTNATNPCDLARLKHRPARRSAVPAVFYGNIASGDRVMRSGSERDRIAGDCNAICFEMEAAGLENSFPCIVIRGICDYADSHKEKVWQKYAAATAASFAKEFLHFVACNDLNIERPVRKQTILSRSMTSSFTDRFCEESSPLDLVPQRYQFKIDIPSGLRGVPEIDYHVSRDVEMSRLESYFDAGSNLISCRRTFIVHGMGGTGKTQLCVAFALRSQSRFKHIFWLDGSSKRSVLQSLAQSASHQLGLLTRRNFSVWTPAQNHSTDRSSSLHKIVDQFTEWLSAAENKNWLLIVDNVDRDWRSGQDPEAFDYRTFLPKTQHGNVLITTRLADLQIPLASLKLKSFDHNQALELLQVRAGKQLIDGPSLIERLGRLPLAVAQAGAYLGRTSLPVQRYLKVYESTWAKLMESQKTRSNAGIEISLLATWNISYDQVAEENLTAAGLLRLWAFMDHHKMWFELCDGAMISPADFSWPRWFRTIISDGIAFRDSMQVLVSYSMVSTAANEEQTYTMHPVLHDWALNYARLDTERSQLFMMAAGLVGSACSRAQETEVEKLIPHARRVAEIKGTDFGSQTADWLRIIAEFLATHDALAESESLLKQVRSFYEEEWGPGDKRSLGVVTSQANLYLRQGKTELAEKLYRTSWSIISEMEFRHRSVDLMRVGHALADIHIIKEEWPDAELLLLDCQKWVEGTSYQRELFGLETMQRLGHVYWMRDKNIEAEATWLHALRLSPQGKGDETTIDIRRDLGDLYNGDGEYTKAEAMYRKCDEISVEAFGPSSITTLNTKLNLANFLRERGRHPALEELWQQAFDMCRSGDESDQIPSYRTEFEAVASSNLALALLLRGKLGAAHEVLRQSVTLCGKAYGTIHTTTLMLMEHLQAVRDNIMYTSRHRIGETRLQGLLARAEGNTDPNLLIRTEVERYVEVRDARSKRASSKIPIRTQDLADLTSKVKRPRYRGLAWETHVSNIMSCDEPVIVPDPTNLHSLLQQRVLFQMRRGTGLWRLFADLGIWHGSVNRQRRRSDFRYLSQLFSVPNLFLQEIGTAGVSLSSTASQYTDNEDGYTVSTPPRITRRNSEILQPAKNSVPAVKYRSRPIIARHARTGSTGYDFSDREHTLLPNTSHSLSYHSTELELVKRGSALRNLAREVTVRQVPDDGFGDQVTQHEPEPNIRKSLQGSQELNIGRPGADHRARSEDKSPTMQDAKLEVATGAVVLEPMPHRGVNSKFADKASANPRASSATALAQNATSFGESIDSRAAKQESTTSDVDDPWAWVRPAREPWSLNERTRNATTQRVQETPDAITEPEQEIDAGHSRIFMENPQEPTRVLSATHHAEQGAETSGTEQDRDAWSASANGKAAKQASTEHLGRSFKLPMRKASQKVFGPLGRQKPVDPEAKDFESDAKGVHKILANNPVSIPGRASCTTEEEVVLEPGVGSLTERGEYTSNRALPNLAAHIANYSNAPFEGVTISDHSTQSAHCISTHSHATGSISKATQTESSLSARCTCNCKPLLQEDVLRNLGHAVETRDSKIDDIPEREADNANGLIESDDDSWAKFATAGRKKKKRKSERASPWVDSPPPQLYAPRVGSSNHDKPNPDEANKKDESAIQIITDAAKRKRMLIDAWAAFESNGSRPRPQKRTTFTLEPEYIPQREEATPSPDDQWPVAQVGKSEAPKGSGVSQSRLERDEARATDQSKKTDRGKYNAIVEDVADSPELEMDPMFSHRAEDSLPIRSDVTAGKQSIAPTRSHSLDAHLSSRSEAHHAPASSSKDTSRGKSNLPMPLSRRSSHRESDELSISRKRDKSEAQTRHAHGLHDLARTYARHSYHAPAIPPVRVDRRTQSEIATNAHFPSLQPFTAARVPYLIQGGLTMGSDGFPYDRVSPYSMTQDFGGLVNGRPSSFHQSPPISARTFESSPYPRSGGLYCSNAPWDDPVRRLGDDTTGHVKSRDSRRSRSSNHRMDSRSHDHDQPRDTDHVVVSGRDGKSSLVLSRRQIREIARQLEQSSTRRSTNNDRRSASRTAETANRGAEGTASRHDLPGVEVHWGKRPDRNDPIISTGSTRNHLSHGFKRSKGVEAPEAPLPQHVDTMNTDVSSVEGIGYAEPRAPPSSSYPSHVYGKGSSEQAPRSSLYRWTGEDDVDGPSKELAGSRPASPADPSRHPYGNINDGRGSPPEYKGSGAAPNRFVLLSSTISAWDEQISYRDPPQSLHNERRSSPSHGHAAAHQSQAQAFDSSFQQTHGHRSTLNFSNTPTVETVLSEASETASLLSADDGITITEITEPYGENQQSDHELFQDAREY